MVKTNTRSIIKGDNPVNVARVNKIPTFKSGNFPFSRNYQFESVVGDYVLFQALDIALSQLPILPSTAAKLETDLVRRAIFGTAAIEGNPLTEDQVGEIIEEPTLNGLRDRAEQEIVNLKEAYRLFAVPQSSTHGKPLRVTEELIRDINERVTRGVGGEHHAPGMYRDHRVEVGNADHGGKYVPPRMRADIAPLMAAFAEWMNSEEMFKEHPPVRAALAHYHLALIHPFGDGNGRTARLLEVAIMAQNGYRFVPTMLSNYYYKNIGAYYIAFRACEKSKEYDMTPFVAFVVAGLKESVLELQDTIHTHIRLLALGNHYRQQRDEREITQRQYDLLNILLQTPGKVISHAILRTDPLLAPLYRRTSEMMPRRDLKRLQELKLLLPAEGGGLRLNQFTLG